MTDYTPTIGDHITLTLGSNVIAGRVMKDRFDDAHWLPWGDESVEHLLAAGAHVTVHQEKGPNPVLAAFKASAEEHQSSRTDKDEDEEFIESWREDTDLRSVTDIRNPRLLELLDHYSGLWASEYPDVKPVDYTLPGQWVLLADDELISRSAINEMLQAVAMFEGNLRV